MSADSGFGARTMAGLIAAAVVLAVAFVGFGVAAPDWRDGRDGGTHALSTAAVGFAGLARLARDAGVPVRLSRRSGDAGAALLVLTPTPATDPDALDRLVRAQDDAPVLIVLPKWQTLPLGRRRDWVEAVGPLPGLMAAAPLAKLLPREARQSLLPDFTVTTHPSAAAAMVTSAAEVRFAARAPARAATIAAAGLQPVLTDADGRIVAGRLPARNAYILADPDLLDNVAMKDPASARAALGLLTQLGGGSGAIVFDLTLDGFGRPYDLARLALTPPFLGATLCLVAALLLAGATAAVRFGAPQPVPRPIAFGTRALVDNAAALVRLAGREPVVLGRYAQLTGEAAAGALGAPGGLDAAALAGWLTARGGRAAAFAPLAAAAATATDPGAVAAAARDLFVWQRAVVHDRR